MDRSILVWLVVFVMLLGSCATLNSATLDNVVLRTKDRDYNDHFTTLWVVDEGTWRWIRAARPDRSWLVHIRQNARVRLEQGETTAYYEATVTQDDAARREVDRMMREKYGLADRVRERVLGTETVTVRLVASD